MAKTPSELEKEIIELNKKIAELKKSLSSAYDPSTIDKFSKSIEKLTASLEKSESAHLKSLQREEESYENVVYNLQRKARAQEKSLNLDKKTTAESTKLREIIEKIQALKNTENDSTEENLKLAKQLTKDLSRAQLEYEDINEELKLARESANAFLTDVSKGIERLPIIGKALSSGFDAFITSSVGKKVRDKLAEFMFDPDVIGKSLIGATGLGMTAAGVGLVGAGIKANLARQQELKDQQRSLSLTKEQTLLVDATQRRLLLSSKSSVISLEEARKASAALVKDFGQLGTDNEHLIEQQNRLVKYYGMQEEEAANFQKISKVNGEDAEVFRKRIIAITSGFNKLRGSSIPMNEIMKTISNYSAQIRIQFKGTKDELVGATIKAKLLGTSLEDLNGIADNLLNIESSIENQVTAQLVTGRRISLDAARRYALENDMLGLMTELQKQNIDYYTYSHMNRVEQQSTAAALGMNVEQMSKFVEQQELANRLGIKTTGNLEYNLSQQRQLIEAAAKNNDELAQKYMLENETLSNQEKLTAAVNKMAEVFKVLNALIVGVGAGLIAVGITMAIIARETIKAAIAALTWNSAFTFGIGALVAVTAAAAAYNMMPGMASGGDVVGGNGPVVVGENGPEIVRLRRGNSVTPNSQLNTVGADNKETNELLKQLIEKVDQPVLVKLGDTTINELGNQITMKRDYRAGVGNTYNRVR